MIKFGFLLLWFITISACNSTKSNTSNLDCEKALIGTWDYVETRNQEGEIIAFYEEEFGGQTMKIMTEGPTIVLFPDKSYKQVFTPDNTDTGYWYFNKSSMTIEYDLLIDSTDWIGISLIEKGLAIKQEDGLYYERIEDKVIQFEKENLVIDEQGRQLLYRKKK